MKRDFAEKVLRAGIYDAKKYRYVAKEAHDHFHQWTEIRRLPLKDLDTTAAINGWELMYIFDQEETDELKKEYSHVHTFKLEKGGRTVIAIRENGVYSCYKKNRNDIYVFMFDLPVEQQSAREALDIAMDNINLY